MTRRDLERMLLAGAIGGVIGFVLGTVLGLPWWVYLPLCVAEGWLLGRAKSDNRPAPGLCPDCAAGRHDHSGYMGICSDRCCFCPERVAS